MKNRSLFLAWQDKKFTRRWFPVGRLDEPTESRAEYEFKYIQGALRAKSESRFEPLLDFPDFEKVYRSGDLFPLFKNRVMTETRKDFTEYTRMLGLRENEVDPFEILAVDGGFRATDAYEVFPKLEKNEDGGFRCQFFLHGLRHVNEHSQDRVNRLKTGERLSATLELTNPETRVALQIQSEDYCMLGWAPRYLVSDLMHAMAFAPGNYEAEVIRINPVPAPSKQRVLVEFRGQWPGEYEPMETEEYQPIAA